MWWWISITQFRVTQWLDSPHNAMHVLQGSLMVLFWVLFYFESTLTNSVLFLYQPHLHCSCMQIIFCCTNRLRMTMTFLASRKTLMLYTYLWVRHHGLVLNPSKMKLLIITRKHHYPSTHLGVNGVPICDVQTATYLADFIKNPLLGYPYRNLFEQKQWHWSPT